MRVRPIELGWGGSRCVVLANLIKFWGNDHVESEQI